MKNFVEIEVGALGSKGWGYVIHVYEGDFETGLEYDGCTDPVYGFENDDEAYEAGLKRLDQMFGKGNWIM